MRGQRTTVAMTVAVAAVAVGVTAAPAAAAAPTAAPTARAFATCADLNEVYPQGVGLYGARDRPAAGQRPVTTFFRHVGGYRHNDGLVPRYSGERDLDHDGDGIACERAEPAYPRAVVPVHGGTYYAVYLSVRRSHDAETRTAVRQARDAGYARFVAVGSMQLGCDRGAAERLGLDPAQVYAVVALFFPDRPTAVAFDRAHAPSFRGAASVTTYCLD